MEFETSSKDYDSNFMTEERTRDVSLDLPTLPRRSSVIGRPRVFVGEEERGRRGLSEHVATGVPLSSWLQQRRRENQLVERIETLEPLVEQRDPALLHVARAIRQRHTEDQALKRINYGKLLWGRLRDDLLLRSRIKRLAALKHTDLTLGGRAQLPPLKGGSAMTEDPGEDSRSEDVLPSHNSPAGSAIEAGKKTADKHKRTKITNNKRPLTMLRSAFSSKPRGNGRKGHPASTINRKGKTDRRCDVKTDGEGSKIDSGNSVGPSAGVEEPCEQQTTEKSHRYGRLSDRRNRKSRPRFTAQLRSKKLPPLVGSAKRRRKITEQELAEIRMLINNADNPATERGKSSTTTNSSGRVWSFNWVPTMHKMGALPSFYGQVPAISERAHQRVRSSTSERAERLRNASTTPTSTRRHTHTSPAIRNG